MQENLQFSLKVEDVTDDLIMKRCRSFSDALKLSRDCCPEKDEYIIEEMCRRAGRERVIQPSHFSEMLSGKRSFPQDLIQHLEDICGNLIPTRFLALSRNQELRPKKEAWQIENEHLRTRLQETERDLEVITRFMQKVKG